MIPRLFGLWVLLFAAIASAQLTADEIKALPVGEVVRVVDGDTVVLQASTSSGTQQYTCRLIGVDTPETVHPSQPVEEYGKEASAFLTNLLKGEKVWIEQEAGNERDRYGRSLVYLYRQPDGMFINLEIVRQGYGHAYTQYPFKYMETFRAYEAKAREAGKGLWGAAANIAPSESAPQTQSAAANQATVYGTNTGTKYHRAGCRSLANSRVPMTVEQARARGLEPCGICKP